MCKSGVRTPYGVQYGPNLLGVTVVVFLFTVIALLVMYQLLPESFDTLRSTLIPIALALLVVVLILYNRYDGQAFGLAL
ncbi:MAG: hypothetical protein JSW05_07185 [Candidatus Thorarchaeota archaeon]|nr:MAG: hypothetical protein JSW05_07185 [Candidatus Thorarchaeota archaeon]